MPETRIKHFVKDWGVYLKPVSLRMFFLGFSAGLPLLLVLGTLSFWLREASIDLKTIGFFSWIGLVYALKWLWAPLVDHMTLPGFHRRLGQRRGWLLLAQLGVIAALLGMAFTNPAEHLTGTLFFALMVAFCSATQDIALDAYRIESSKSEWQGVLSAMYQAGYRLAMIWAGAGALALASMGTDTTLVGYAYGAWRFAYLVMAASMGVGVVTVLISPEPSPVKRPKVVGGFLERIKVGFVEPIVDYFKRYQRMAWVILLLVAAYRISDVVMGVMANPFYHDMGFTKSEVALVTKVFGVLMTLLGAFVGGMVTMKLGVLKTLFLGGVLSAATNVLFSLLAQVGHSVGFLVLTVSADNLASGIASAAFVAYLSSLTNRMFSATQYALLSSLMVLLPKSLAGFSGVLVEATSFSTFFLLTALMGIPVLLLIGYIIHASKGSD